jgi:uncharacterized MAPEG superfamily protein
MQTNLSPELFWLTCTVLMTTCMWVPYVLNRILELGLWPALGNPQPGQQVNAAWARRSAAAHSNAIENLVLFAALVLTIQQLGINDGQTTALCAVYFFARAAHFVIYLLGIPVLRTLSFAVGFAAQIMLALKILGLI